MANPILPKAQSHIAEPGRETSREWYEFFRKLLVFVQESGADAGVIQSILERLDELEEDSLGDFSIQGLVSVKVFGTPQGGVVEVQLENDVGAPGNTYYYGTDSTGVKGWSTIASAFTNGDGIDLVTGLDGVTDISFNADTAEVAHLPGATYSTVQKMIDVMFSPGIITGGEVTELTSTSVRITGGTAVVRIADDNVSELRFFDFASQDFSVPDVQVTHFYALDYNGGAPTIIESTVTENWDRDTEIPLGSALRGDGMLNVTPNPYRVGDVITNLIQRLDAIGPVQRDNSVGGLALGEAGTRNVTVSGGRLWSRVSDFTVPSKNSSVDTMATIFFNGTNLTVTSGVTQWDNQNYNDVGAGTLVPIGNNKWANLWFFMSFDGTKYGFAYGTAEHNTLGDAANEGIPAYLTQNFFNQFALLGRFVFQESAATAAQIESAFSTPFTTQAINTHNDLGGLQGGAVGEFYHLTAAQQADVATLSTGGTTGQFFRGDQVYTNELEGPFSARATIDTATLGPELVTNGTFTGSAAGWTLGAGWAYAANNVAFTVGGAGTLSQSVTVTAGQRYRLSWTQQHSVVNSASITPSLGAAVGITTSYNNTGTNTQEQIITALTTGAVALTFTPASILGGGTVTIDAVSLMSISTIPSVIEGENVAGTAASEVRSYATTSNQSYGLDSGRSITSGTDNALFGQQAGSDLTSGTSNTLFGAQAGAKVTTGSGNTIAGRFAGNSTTTGSNNSLFGIRSGQSNVTGSDLTFVGRDAGASNTGGTSNVFVGSVSGSANTIGTSNVFIGLASGNQNTTGNNLVAIGRDAGFNNTTLNNNNYVGSMAGRNNSAGVNSNFFGTNSGQFLADGVTANTGPTQCLYLGGGTRSETATDANSVVIGHGAIGKGTNSVVIGNSSIANNYLYGHWNPQVDNVANLGNATFRFKEVFAGIGVINTSDGREKTTVDRFTAAELAASRELAREVGTYRWLHAIDAKGDAARTHVGLTVQRVMDVMQNHCLDPFRYGFICYDEWPERFEPASYETIEIEPATYGEDGQEETPAVIEHRLIHEAVTHPAGNRYGFRADQLLLFIARGQEERLAALEALLNV